MLALATALAHRRRKDRSMRLALAVTLVILTTGSALAGDKGVLYGVLGGIGGFSQGLANSMEAQRQENLERERMRVEQQVIPVLFVSALFQILAHMIQAVAGVALWLVGMALPFGLGVIFLMAFLKFSEWAAH
jgi:hypothetical protein